MSLESLHKLKEQFKRCELLYLQSLSLQEQNKTTSKPPIAPESPEKSEQVGGGCFKIKFPVIIAKNFSNFSTKEKNAILFFLLLKSKTKSDRLKFKSLNHLYQSFGYSQRTGSQIFIRMREMNLIHFTNKYIQLYSFQKVIHTLLQKEIKRQNIKFIDIELNQFSISELKEKFIQKFIQKNISAQEKQIEKKIKIAIAFKHYEGVKIEKTFFKYKNDSKQGGAALFQIFEKIEQRKNNNQFIKYVKRYSKYFLPQQLPKGEYFNYTMEQLKIDKPKDYYCVILTCRNFANKLGYSHTYINNKLNELNYLVRKFYIGKKDSYLFFKKMYQEGNFYIFGEKCFFLRAF